MTDTAIVKETIYPKGAPVVMDAVRVGGQVYLVSGTVLRTASLKDEWDEDVEKPGHILAELTKCSLRIDLLKFWQRIPETSPKFSYYTEWQPVAAIPVTTYKHWWDKQIRFRARNKMRKAEKLGVVIQEAEFNDDLVRGVMGIYNQSPIRRGKPFRHYGKDFATVKAELAIDLSEALFVTAFYEEELVGFIKLQIADRYARITLILDKVDHRDKSPTNGMIAKVVEICAERGIPFVTYNLWRRGDHGKFQESVGFEKFSVPEYFVPLSLLGRMALALRLHRGLKGVLPEWMIVRFLGLRAEWYSRKLARRGPRPSSALPKGQAGHISHSGTL